LTFKRKTNILPLITTKQVDLKQLKVKDYRKPPAVFNLIRRPTVDATAH